MIFDLMRDFADILDALPAPHPRRRILALLAEAIRRNGHFVDRHPTTVFQCLWNSCWWHEAPDELDGNPARDPQVAPKPQDGHLASHLRELVRLWRSERERALPGFPWIESLRPLPGSLGSRHSLRVPAHSGPVSSIQRGPVADQVLSLGKDEVIRLSDCELGRVITDIPVVAAGASADGRLVIGVHHKEVVLCDTESGATWARIDIAPESVVAAAIGHDTRLVALGRSDGTLALFDPASGEQVKTLPWQGPPTRHLIFAAGDDRWLLAADRHALNFWDTGDGRHFAGFYDPIWALEQVIVPDRSRVLSVWRLRVQSQGGKQTRSGVATYWQEEQKTLLRLFSTPSLSHIATFKVRPNGLTASPAADDVARTVHVDFEWEYHSIGALAMGPGTDEVVAWLSDGRLVRWSLDSGRQEILGVTDREVTAILYDHTRSVVVAGLATGELDVWRLDRERDTNLPAATMPADKQVAPVSESVFRTEFYGNGRFLVTVSKVKRLSDESYVWGVWDGRTGRRHFRSEPSENAKVVVSPSGRRLACIQGHRATIIHRDWGRLCSFEGAEVELIQVTGDWFEYSGISDLIFSPDESHIIAVGHTGCAWLFATATGRRIAVLQPGGLDSSGLSSVAFSLDGSLALTHAAKDGAVSAVDVRSGDPVPWEGLWTVHSLQPQSEPDPDAVIKVERRAHDESAIRVNDHEFGWVPIDLMSASASAEGALAGGKGRYVFVGRVHWDGPYPAPKVHARQESAIRPTRMRRAWWKWW